MLDHPSVWERSKLWCHKVAFLKILNIYFFYFQFWYIFLKLCSRFQTFRTLCIFKCASLICLYCVRVIRKRFTYTKSDLYRSRVTKCIKCKKKWKLSRSQSSSEDNKCFRFRIATFFLCVAEIVLIPWNMFITRYVLIMKQFRICL